MSSEIIHFISSASQSQDANNIQRELAVTNGRIFLIIDDVFERIEMPESYQIIINNYTHIQFHCGEIGKTINQAQNLWSWLSSNRVEKSDFLWFIGGGSLSDLGGFCSSTFKRGIPFGFIPTTLLAMVDASIGGKNGINFNEIKNSIGTFQHPQKILVDPTWLNTLPEDEMLNGWMELCKHGLISDVHLWNDLTQFNLKADPLHFGDLIERGISVKRHVVEKDFLDRGERKKLNFGHTVGHAIESLSIAQGEHIGHGIAIGWGMVVALEWSSQEQNLKQDHPLRQAQSKLRKILMDEAIDHSFQRVKSFETNDLWSFMVHDKKNSNSQVLEVKLLEIGHAEWDQPMDFESFRRAWEKAFY